MSLKLFQKKTYFCIKRLTYNWDYFFAALVKDLCKLKKEKKDLKIVKEKVAKKSTMKPELQQ